MQKTKDRATQITQKTGINSGAQNKTTHHGKLKR
jgi:hypothetical protein